MNAPSGNEDEASIDAEGKTAWFNSISIAYKHQDWGPLMDHLRNNPEDGKKVDGEYGGLPLHYGCLFNAPLEVIKELLDIYPEAAFSKDKRGFLPIFCLLSTRCGTPSVDAVKLVIDSNSTGLGTSLTRANDSRSFPIYNAFLNERIAPEVFELVIKATPKREHPRLVRFACKRAKIIHKEKMEVILNCVESKVLRIADIQGRLALHLACNNPILSDDFVLALHKKYPDAGYERDNAGNYPNIHSRIESKMETLNGRLEAYNQKVEGLTIATVMSDAARRREEVELDATKLALADERKRNRQLEQELRQLKKLRRAKN